MSEWENLKYEMPAFSNAYLMCCYNVRQVMIIASLLFIASLAGGLSDRQSWNNYIG